ncbi:unnamed protein product [Bemisia tabaci]|uniref:DNA 3'-5' helicase n=1 Tax=Bemisia tabaci TaxID=7038 RepID=A0A9P0A9F5_BEMTA|nr:unnamed protein product [Bemisia tabaci]
MDAPNATLVIIIVPLIALLHDFMRKLVNRINIVEARSNRLDVHLLTNVHHHLQNNRTVFILVTPETLNRSPDLRVFAQAAGFPVAFVSDEAHTVPSWGLEFREELLRLAETIRFIPDSQLILSSASISLPDIKFIERCYGEEIETVFTQLFIRRNVKYTVLPVQTLPGGKKSLQKFISSFNDIATFLNDRFPHDSVIVFIENKKQVNTLAAGLNGIGFPVVRYHSDMTPNGKTVAMGSWLGGNPRFIVATSAISLGVDSERCVGTVNFGQASSIYNLIQETGRVGRRGQPSECITVTDASFTYNKLCSTIEFHQKRVEKIPVKTILAGNAELLAWAATTQRLMCIPAMLLKFVDPSIEPAPQLLAIKKKREKQAVGLYKTVKTAKTKFASKYSNPSEEEQRTMKRNLLGLDPVVEDIPNFVKSSREELTLNIYQFSDNITTSK